VVLLALYLSPDAGLCVLAFHKVRGQALGVSVVSERRASREISLRRTVLEPRVVRDSLDWFLTVCLLSQ
jgi:hypothetical protein